MMIVNNNDLKLFERSLLDALKCTDVAVTFAHSFDNTNSTISMYRAGKMKQYKIGWCDVDSLTIKIREILDDASWVFYHKNLEDTLSTQHPTFKSKTLFKAPTVPHPEIKQVIFNPPATIIFWFDGTKTVVKCQEGDIFDPEKGMTMAITKKFFGNTGSYCNEIKKWTKDYEPEIPTITFDGSTYNNPLAAAMDNIAKCLRSYGVKSGEA